MSGNLQPLDQQFSIVDTQGRPTRYFVQWAQQKQLDIEGAITSDQATAILVAYLAAHPLVAGSGITLTPDGNLSDGPTIAAQASAILDQISAVRGTVLYRGAGGWAALAPGAAGQFLETQGAGADPLWAAAGGSSGPWYAGHIPLAADFPGSASGNATLAVANDDANLGLRIDWGTTTSGIERVVHKALPSLGAADWTATARIMFDFWPGFVGDIGMGLLESATGKMVTHALSQNGTTLNFRTSRGTLTVFTAALFTGTNNTGIVPIWFRINYVNATSTYTFSISINGKDFFVVTTMTAATAFTTRADKVGFAMVTGASSALTNKSYSDYWVQNW